MNQFEHSVCIGVWDDGYRRPLSPAQLAMCIFRKALNSWYCARHTSSRLQNDLARLEEGFQVRENTRPATRHGVNQL